MQKAFGLKTNDFGFKNDIRCNPSMMVYHTWALHSVVGVCKDSSMMGVGKDSSLISFHSMTCRIPT